jgi:hypothetical protein
MPPVIAGNKRFAACWQAVFFDSFWSQLRQYVKLNEIVAAAITYLGGATATLSDAALKMMQLKSQFLSLSAGLPRSAACSRPQCAPGIVATSLSRPQAPTSPPCIAAGPQTAYSSVCEGQ